MTHTLHYERRDLIKIVLQQTRVLHLEPKFQLTLLICQQFTKTFLGKLKYFCSQGRHNKWSTTLYSIGTTIYRNIER